ncbi:PatB family C-S lyase [Entomomonas sp. E2T0]|uniref:MalY/PatB family protein n=1 Tax=Entomomonas sp. E2T0 TaxID=2930213 RepID=UPI002228366C|nr:PatB family C-S lyase [Entomomonas sp. E2T0]UYZ84400.1 PatB family C-S lyase [Entomomonas sp. E2T0]
MFNFDQVINRANTDSLKWQKYAAKDIIPLWIADTDFLSPPSIMNALQERVAEGVYGYGGQPKELAKAFINWTDKHYNWQIQPEWLVFLPGLVTGLNISLRAFTNETEASICPFPIYPPFMAAAKHVNRKQYYANLLNKNNRWVMDLSTLENKLDGNEKLLMLCNPQNPGGTVYRHEELLEQLAFAKQHNMIVCSDEIHCDLLLESNLKHIPFASLNEDAANRSITLMAPSKTFNIAGLGASIAIIPNPQLRQKFMHVMEDIVPHLNILAYTAAISAYTDTSDWLAEQLIYLRGNRDYLYQQINSIEGLKLLPIEASYLAWIDATKLPIENPHRFFEEAGVGLSDGNDFGCDKFLRLNFGCSRVLLEQAIERMKIACSKL